MINKKLQEDLRKELTECFKVFYASLNQHEKFTTVQNGVKKYLEDLDFLMNVSDDVDLKVKFICYMPDGTIKHTPYQPIQKFIKEGVDIPEGVERIEAQVKAVIRKNDHVLESADNHPFFKSEVFVLEENVQSKMSKLYVDSIKRKEGKGVIVSIQDLQEFSGNRIRFAENAVLGV